MTRVVAEQQTHITELTEAYHLLAEAQRRTEENLQLLTERVNSPARTFKEWIRLGGDGARPN